LFALAIKALKKTNVLKQGSVKILSVLLQKKKQYSQKQLA
jgi:hypothetical protein